MTFGKGRVIIGSRTFCLYDVVKHLAEATVSRGQRPRQTRDEVDVWGQCAGERANRRESVKRDR